METTIWFRFIYFILGLYGPYSSMYRLIYRLKIIVCQNQQDACVSETCSLHVIFDWISRKCFYRTVMIFYYPYCIEISPNPYQFNVTRPYHMVHNGHICTRSVPSVFTARKCVPFWTNDKKTLATASNVNMVDCHADSWNLTWIDPRSNVAPRLMTNSMILI